MGQPPLNRHGGDARRIGVRLPDELLGRVALAAAARDITISEFVRHATEVELGRLDIELAEAAGMALLPVPDGGKAPPG